MRQLGEGDPNGWLVGLGVWTSATWFTRLFALGRAPGQRAPTAR